MRSVILAITAFFSVVLLLFVAVRLADFTITASLASPPSQRLEGVTILKGHSKPVWSVAFSPKGQRLASAGDDGVRFWDVTMKKELSAIRGNAGHLTSIAFHPTGKLIAWGGDFGRIILWDVEKTQEKATLEEHKDGIWSSAFSPDGKVLASGSADQTVILWDVTTRQKIKVLSGHKADVDMLAFNSDGTLLMSVGSKLSARTAEVKIWDTKTWTEKNSVAVRSFCRPKCVAVEASFKYLAVCTWDPILWDLGAQKEKAVFKGHKKSPNAVRFNHDGKLLASGGEDRQVKVWDVANGKELVTFGEPTTTVISLAFSSDDTHLAAGSEDGTVLLWKLPGK